MKDELLYLIWFTCNTSFSPSVKRFLDVYSAKELYSFSKSGYIRLGFGEAQAEKLSNKNLTSAEKILNICKFRDIVPIAYDSCDYPEKLLKTRDFPLVLYARGNISILKSPFVAGIVGTRSSSPEGERFTERIADELIDCGAVIISGGASGIDTAGLLRSVKRRTPCIAVLGCDIDRYYPAENYAMLEHIASNGLVISEYPPGTNARYFPVRNRIIAALSDRLLVTEAPEKSGALITAEHASDYGVPVFSTPFGEGCRELLSRGAREIVTAEDIVSFSFPTPIKTAKKTVQRKAAEKIEIIREEKVYNDARLLHIINCIKEGKDTPEKMIDKEHGITEVLTAVTELEIMGEITELPGNKFRIN